MKPARTVLPQGVSRPASKLGRTLVLCAAAGWSCHWSPAAALGRAGGDLGTQAFAVLACAAAVALLCLRPLLAAPAIYDRQVDLVVGLALLAPACCLERVTAARFGGTFVRYGLDWPALGLFAAAALAMLVGCRALWRLRAVPLLVAAVALTGPSANPTQEAVRAVLAAAVLCMLVLAGAPYAHRLFGSFRHPDAAKAGAR